MKPLGRKYFKHCFGKKDFHLHSKKHRKIKNWWEEICTPNKDLEKRLVEKEINEQTGR